MTVLSEPALVVAPLLLGATIEGRGVRLGITEVEAYMGADDPGSHGYRGLRAANRHLFGPPGTLYAYRSYGIHTCCNVVCGAEGTSSGVLLRGARVLDGVEVARSRRGAHVAEEALARGPGNLGTVLGAVLGTDDGTSLLDGSGPFVLAFPPGLEARLASAPPLAVSESLLAERLEDGSQRIGRGPRTGVAGPAGGAAFPWRFWTSGDPTVSTYRRHPKAVDGSVA